MSNVKDAELKQKSLYDIETGILETKTLTRTLVQCNSSPAWDHPSFSLKSLNILSRLYAHAHKHYCCEAVLNWETRKYRLLEVLLEPTSDIICLQEDDAFEEWFEPELNRVGYDGIHMKKPFRPDGCSIFWNREKFRLLDEKKARLIGKEFGISDQSNSIVLLAALEHLPTTSRLVVATTHLKAGERCSYIRTSQGALVMKTIETFVGESPCFGAEITPSSVPILLCGDLNGIQDEDVHQFFRTGELNNVPAGEMRSRKNFRHDFQIKSAYDSLEPNGYRLYTALQPGCYDMIDFIYYSTSRLSVTHCLEIPNPASYIDPYQVAQGRPQVFLPCASYPPDHLALMSHFEFKNDLDN